MKQALSEISNDTESKILFSSYFWAFMISQCYSAQIDSFVYTLALGCSVDDSLSGKGECQLKHVLKRDQDNTEQLQGVGWYEAFTNI